MTILDRYVTKNFLIGYLIAFAVTIGMCITTDLFVNIDEFAENADLGVGAMMHKIVTFYALRMLLWYRDLAGVIVVIAAVFSLARMTRSNELIAVMSSGVSLKRLIAPIILLAAILTAVQIVDQELIIPRYAHQLTLGHEDMTSQKAYDLWFASDSEGNLLCAGSFDESTGLMTHPYIILRQRVRGKDQWNISGYIRAAEARYDYDRQGWILKNGTQTKITGSAAVDFASPRVVPVDFLASDLKPEQIPMRKQEGYKSLLSSAQLIELAQNEGTRQSDLAELYLQKHSRITDPIMNLVMLLVALPVLVCRDPRDMKSAIAVSFATTAGCFVLIFICKMFATEVFMNQIRPELWAWAPIFIFVPVAFIQMDSMKT